jgi:hypothetical protein
MSRHKKIAHDYDNEDNDYSDNEERDLSNGRSHITQTNGTWWTASCTCFNYRKAQLSSCWRAKTSTLIKRWIRSRRAGKRRRRRRRRRPRRRR